MKTSDFWYDLPQELIAQHPTEKRDQSKLLVLEKQTGAIEQKVFSDIIDYLNEGDCLVVNKTKVIPARLIGKRKITDKNFETYTNQTPQGGGVMEFLLLKNLGNDCWETLAKPGKRAKVGTEFVFSDSLSAIVQQVLPDGNRIVKFEYSGIFENVLDEVGQMPLPPYITEKLIDKHRYQTVYSKDPGSAAAPTAGLHFTPELLDRIEKKGVAIVEILLHVGLGTFRPVKSDNIEEHKMHSEYFCVSQQNAKSINNAKSNNKKVVCVGTTSARAIESSTDSQNKVVAKSGETDIFISPGYNFKVVDKLITNFHLPESTLLMLISALAGKEKIFEAYKFAVENKYRFFSFGDAMLIK